jgi:hypothetical protein
MVASGRLGRAAARATRRPCRGCCVNDTFWKNPAHYGRGLGRGLARLYHRAPTFWKNLAKYGLGLALLAFVIWNYW